MASLSRLGTTITLLLCALCCRAGIPQPYQVFFVSIGSGWYVNPRENDVHGFSRIPGANKSAKIIADTLVAGGAVYGIDLTSNDQAFVTVPDMYKAIQLVADKMVAAKPQRPLFVFYFAGHGMSEGIAWSHFSIPGDFAYRGDAANLNIEGLSNSTLYAGALVDELQKLHVPFLVMLDNCYDGKERPFESSVLSAVATRNLKDVGAILRAMNEFRDTYPVIFSTTPGKSVLTVVNPLEPNSQVTIGPLARRFSLSVLPALDKGRPISLDTFLGNMVSQGLDTLTNPAVTHSPVPEGANAFFLVHNASKHSIDERLGTGTRMEICCRSIPTLGTPTKVNSSDFTGKLSITGNVGEYISSGRSIVFASPSYKVMVTQQGVGNIRIRFEHGETEFDASFSTPSGGRFETKEYTAAQRWNMADPGNAGLEVSGDGRGCGDIVGSFKVSDVVYEADGSVSKLKATFIQLCDDSKLPARGSIELTKTK
jgi:hypothetical protein